MGFKKNTGGSNFKTSNFTYSSFVGLVIHSDERKLYDETLKNAGISDSDIKKGYGTDESFKARKALAEAGISGYRLSGKLGYLAVREKDLGKEGKPNLQKFLTVGLSDGEDAMYLEVAVQHAAASALARKLVNVKPGDEVEVNLFATKSENGFGNHAAEVKSAGVEVPGIGYKDGPGPVIEAKLKALEAAGITDRDVISKTRSAASGEYVEGIVSAVGPAFEAYHAENRKSGKSAADAPAKSDPAQDGDFVFSESDFEEGGGHPAP